MEFSLVLSQLIIFSSLVSTSSEIYPGCYHPNVTWLAEYMIEVPEPATSALECQAICAYFIDVGCSHFTWYSSQNLCNIFKQPTTERECSSDCISATRECGNTCHAKETGGPVRNKVFKIAQGNKEQVYCEEISSPCYMKNSEYQEGWLRVDSNRTFVYDCFNNPRPDLKPLADGKCGFEIRDVDDVHDGEWLCGNIEPDQSAIKVVSKATVFVCDLTSCGSMVGWFDFSNVCGCFSFLGDESLSWSDARKHCQKYQGDLVTLDSFDKQDDIFSHWNQLDIWVNPWIGAYKDGGEWKWASNGETIPEGESENPFSNWDWGQPDVGDCAYFSKAGYGTWASQDCKYEGPFICEWQTLFPRDPCNLLEFGSPSTDKPFIGHKGARQTIFCEDISIESEPCYMKNPGYNDGSWLTVDPNSELDFAYDCDGVTTFQELRPLHNGSCGFKIAFLQERHTGVWTCGSMWSHGAGIEIVSTATLRIE